jgi:ribosomal protein S18 acetylase RimI-like enzyme
MTPLDWRFLTSKEAADLHQVEAARWLSTLHWDTRSSVSRIESARRVGALPGLAARDEQGAVHGWTFYLVHEGVLQIGGFVADSTLATATLLDAIVGAPEAAAVSAMMLFAYSAAPGLTEHLLARSFAVERYRYLAVDLTDPVWDFRASMSTDPGRAQLSAPVAWAPVHLEPVAALLRRAYASDSARPFARGGTPREWLEYVTQLVTMNACGSFFPEASFVVPGDSPGDLDGATLMTRLSADTAHLAQIGVAPDARGRRVARRLLAASLDAARAAGFARATLLVSERNAAANRLYASMRFEEVAAFVSAFRDQPRRSSGAPTDGSGAVVLP